MRQLLSLTYHECWQRPSAAIDYTQVTHLLGIRRGAQNQLIRHLSHLLFQIHCGVHLWCKEEEESVSSATFSFQLRLFATPLMQFTLSVMILSIAGESYCSGLSRKRTVPSC